MKTYKLQTYINKLLHDVMVSVSLFHENGTLKQQYEMSSKDVKIVKLNKQNLSGFFTKCKNQEWTVKINDILAKNPDKMLLLAVTPFAESNANCAPKPDTKFCKILTKSEADEFQQKITQLHEELANMPITFMINRDFQTHEIFLAPSSYKACDALIDIDAKIMPYDLPKLLAVKYKDLIEQQINQPIIEGDTITNRWQIDFTKEQILSVTK